MKYLLLLAAILPAPSFADDRVDGERQCENKSSQDINCTYARETKRCENGYEYTTYIYSCRVRGSNVHGSCTWQVHTGQCN